MNIVALLIGLVLGFGVYLLLARTIAKFKIAPPAEPNPEDVRPVDLRYRCAVCGAEVTMTMASQEEPEAPRHCREDMLLVSEVPVLAATHAPDAQYSVVVVKNPAAKRTNPRAR